MNTRKLPPRIDEPGLLVGYSLEREHNKTPYGFSFGADEYTPSNGYLDPYLFHGEGHLITIAPTGAGKGVASVIPAALRHEGDLVIMDPKGENYAITADFRKSLGQEICLIDPFGVVSNLGIQPTAEPGGINLFDLLPYLADTEQAGAQALAGMILQTSEGRAVDPFWDMSAANILAGLIDFYAHDPEGGSVGDLLRDLVLYPSRRNKLPEHVSALSKLEETNEGFQNLLRRFGLTVVQVEHAFVEDCALKRGETTSSYTVFVPIDEEGCKDFFGEEREVQHTNRPFKVAIREMSGLEVDDSSIDTLWKLAQQAKPPQYTLEQRQARADRFLQRADDSETPYPVAVLRMMASRRQLPERVSAMISATPDKTWGSMIAVLLNGLGYLNAAGIRRTVSYSSVDLKRLVSGTGTSIYLVFPPHRLATHSQLLAALFKGLINLLVSRSKRPEKTTLFIMDEMAQLGHVKEFVAAKTLLRGYGVQVWSFWQDLSQLKQTYPDVWPTIINNCKVFQAFGCATPMMAKALEDLFDVPAASILDLEKDEMLLSVYGDAPVIARLPRYYSDPAFDGVYASNPLQISEKNIAESDRGSGGPVLENKLAKKFNVEIRRRKRIKASTN